MSAADASPPCLLFDDLPACCPPHDRLDPPRGPVLAVDNDQGLTQTADPQLRLLDDDALIEAEARRQAKRALAALDMTRLNDDPPARDRVEAALVAALRAQALQRRGGRTDIAQLAPRSRWAALDHHLPAVFARDDELLAFALEMERQGIRRLGDLVEQPRAAIAARLSAKPLDRLLRRLGEFGLSLDMTAPRWATG